MSIICDNCKYDRNPPTATRCEVCDAPLVGAQQPQPSVSPENLLSEPPQSSWQISTPDLSLPVENLRSHNSVPPPTINIQPPKQQQSSDPPPTIDIQPPRQQPSPTPPSIQTNSSSMTITCPQCGYDRNAIGTEFCDVCGYEFSPLPVESFPTSEPTKLQESPPNPYPISTTPVASGNTAKLIAKQTDSPTAEFVLEHSNLVGRFDPDSGPVEIDLEGFAGADYISRNHAEIYREAGQWKIKDLGSENGVFLKRLGQTRFSPRITTPEILNSGDEIAFAKIRFLFQSL